MTTTYTASNGQDLRPGLAVPAPTGREAISFQLFAVCDGVPNDWHGEARLGSHVVLRTGPAASEAAAGRLIERQLAERIVQVFTPTD